MLMNYLMGLLINVQASLITFQKKAKRWTINALFLTLSALACITIGMALKNPGVMFVGSIISVLVFVSAYWLGIMATVSVEGLANQVINHKDKDAAARQKEAVQKLVNGMKRISKCFLTMSMILAFISLWPMVFGFSSYNMTTIMIITLVSSIFAIIGFIDEKEATWPKYIVAIMSFIALVFWFSTLDTPVSRALAVRINNHTINLEKDSDAKATAVVISGAILYRIDDKGEMDEIVSSDTVLPIGTTVRVGKIKRADGETFTEIVIPNENGSYARGVHAYVQPQVLSGKGLTVYPNTVSPEYAISKEKVSGKEVWKVYFLTDEPISFPVKRGKIYTFTGVNSGDIWATKSGAAGTEAGQFGNNLKAGVRYRNSHDDVFTLMAKKGTALTITWSNG